MRQSGVLLVYFTSVESSFFYRELIRRETIQLNLDCYVENVGELGYATKFDISQINTWHDLQTCLPSLQKYNLADLYAICFMTKLDGNMILSRELINDIRMEAKKRMNGSIRIVGMNSKLPSHERESQKEVFDFQYVDDIASGTVEDFRIRWKELMS